MVANSEIQEPFETILASGEHLQSVLREARRAAASDVGVLLTGETGTGKEMLARAIHAASRRSEGPFVALDCASLPQGTLQSELFGHRRGSFSGAERDRVGRIEAAGGGTLFLDRIDELDPGAQAHLLRVLQEREVLALGESRPRRVDFRSVASAAPDLRRLVSEGRFRADLYYRINVVELALPPLRERREDITLLAAKFIADSSRRFGKPLRGFSASALEVLVRFDWPGNVRELQCVVEAAAAAARGELVQESDLPVRLRTACSRERAAPAASPAQASPAAPGPKDEPGSFAEQVEGFQRALILEALARNLWSHRLAARELGLERHQIKYLCAKLGIRRSR